MPETYTVTKVKYAGERDNPHGGKLHKFYVSVKNADDATEAHDVYWQRKSDELHEGQEVYGHIEQGEYGPRFKTDPKPDRQGSFSKHVQRDNGLSKDDYWRNKEVRDIESQARMGRAHAQQMAVRVAGAAGYFKGRVDDYGKFTDLMLPLIDWFHQDVQRFPLDADVGGGTSADSDPPVSQASAADVSAEASPQLKGKATQLLNKAGLAEGARKAVILFRCGTLKNPPQGRVRSLVTDLEQGATAEALLAEISDARANGDEVAAEAVKLLPPGAPVDASGLPELDADGKQLYGVKDEADDTVPF